MPVSPHGFEAWIEVEGRRLEEFKVEPEGDKIVCWVPCEAGKEFAVGCSIPWNKVATTNHTIHAYLDGKAASLLANVVRHNAYSLDSATRLFKEELVKGDAAVRAFQFGALELTDDDALLNAPAKQFGEITAHISSVQAFVPIQNHNVANFKEDYRAHERSKKGVSHCVRLGEEKPRPGAAPAHNRAVGQKREFTFVFKYRQMDVLVADGIAPRKAKNARENSVASGSTALPPEAGPSSRKRKMAEVKEEDQVAQNLLGPTDDDIERMENELAAMKAKKAQGGSSGSQPPAKRVKQEPKRAFVPGEIIDLTNLPSSSGARVKQEPRASFHGEVIDLT